MKALRITVDGGQEINAAPDIVDAAIRAFDELGYEQASISHIADQAGTSKSLVTYYFPSKRALADAIVDLAYPGGVFMGATRTESDPLDAIVWIAEHITSNVSHNPLARVAILLTDYDRGSGLRAASKFLGWLTKIVDYLEEAQRDGAVPPGVDAAAEARYILCGIIGLIDVATATGAYLGLTNDAVRMTQDRLLHLICPANHQAEEQVEELSADLSRGKTD